MTLARGAAAGALAVAVVVIAVLLLSGGSTHTYHLLFQNAGQLVTGDDVQVGGRRVGSVTKIELTTNNQAQISVDVMDGFAPLHQGTAATIRQTSLSGIANRYVALVPGPNSNPRIADNGFLTADQTTAPVDLDQVFNTLDAPTRRALQQVIQGSAAQYQGKGPQANASAQYFNPLLSTSASLVNEAVRDQQVFSSFITSSSRVVTALEARRANLADLITNSNTTAAAIASQNTALNTDLKLLPITLRNANTTFVNLRSTLNDLDVLTNASKPATKHLAALFAALRPLVAEAIPTIHDLRLLVHQPGPANDLTDLLLKQPALAREAKPALADAILSLQKSQPVLTFIRPYVPDFVGWLRDFGQGASNYDANGHFARISPIFNAYSFTSNPSGGVLTPIPNSQKAAGYTTGASTRCPGAASQYPPDNSAPFRDTTGTLDCNPAQVPPGP
jgi:phospholipid/cholesterol/gamma-HCH transport system substrate-binding protein